MRARQLITWNAFGCKRGTVCHVKICTITIINYISLFYVYYCLLCVYNIILSNVTTLPVASDLGDQQLIWDPNMQIGGGFQGNFRNMNRNMPRLQWRNPKSGFRTIKTTETGENLDFNYSEIETTYYIPYIQHISELSYVYKKNIINIYHIR